MSVAIAAAGFQLGLAGSASGEDAVSPPIWPGEPIRSMGQPPIWKPYGGAAFTFGGGARGTSVHVGVYKDLLPAVAGFGVSGEAYAGTSGDGAAAGFRALADLRGLMLKAGLDHRAGGSTDWIVSFNAPLRRGGLFGHGSLLRVDWVPGRDTWQLGVLIPFERHMGRTRPRATMVALPRSPRPPARRPLHAPAVEQALGQVRVATRWIFQLTHVFWDDSREDRARSLARTRREIAAFKARIDRRDARRPAGANLAGEVSRLHHEMARAFALAADDPSRGEPLQDLARAAMADEVVLPYNRLFGQWKRHDSLLALGATARTRFLAAALAAGVPAVRQAALADVFDGYLRALDDARAASWLQLGRDSRLVFLPLQLVLQPWEHDSQQELDALIGRAVGTPFTRGNRADYITVRQFQAELLRSLHETRDYHVLWLHDYNGISPTGGVDRVGFIQAVDGYLAALTERVREFDATRRLPVYMIFLDQKYYAQYGGRLFMDLLEDPLGHRLRLPPGSQDLQQRADRAQAALRTAVNESRLLQAEAAVRGAGWLRTFVKVHVSIANPADFSFRTSRIVTHLPIAPDHAIRDHRKIAFRDVSEADPGRGEAFYSGGAVGEQYVSATFEDRAIHATGPALRTLKAAALRYLRQNGFSEADLPPPLLPQPRPTDYDERVARLEAAGADVTALAVHNDRGFAQKDASLVNSMLYTLMPAGSLFVVPSSIWTDPVWAGQLVGAALRGCHVYVIAPAHDNAPQGTFVVIARSREVFSRFFEIQRQLAPEIEAAGGRLRTGLYTRRAPAGATDAWLREILAGYRRHPFLVDDFPFAPDLFEALLGAARLPSPLPLDEAFPSNDALPRAKQLHRKTQFLGSRASLQALAEVVVTLPKLPGPAPGAPGARTLGVEDRARLAMEKAWLGGDLAQAHHALPDETRARAVYYLTVGSLNMDTRGHALDGEVMYVQSGESSLVAYTDFAALVGFTTWLDSQEQLDRLLPPVTHLKRWIGRWVRKAV